TEASAVYPLSSLGAAAPKQLEPVDIAQIESAVVEGSTNACGDQGVSRDHFRTLNWISVSAVPGVETVHAPFPPARTTEEAGMVDWLMLATNRERGGDKERCDQRMKHAQPPCRCPSREELLLSRPVCCRIQINERRLKFSPR